MACCSNMFCFLWQQHPFWDILVIDLNTSFWQLHVLTPYHLSHLPESSQQTFYCNFQFSFRSCYQLFTALFLVTRNIIFVQLKLIEMQTWHSNRMCMMMINAFGGVTHLKNMDGLWALALQQMNHVRLFWRVTYTSYAV